MAEPNLYEFLRNVPTVAALVGDRIYPELIPQHLYTEVSRMPCVVFYRAGSDRQPMFCGTDKLVAGVYTIIAKAPHYDVAAKLAGAIRLALVDYSGPMGDAMIQNVLANAETGGNPDPEPGLFNRIETYTIWHLED